VVFRTSHFGTVRKAVICTALMLAASVFWPLPNSLFNVASGTPRGTSGSQRSRPMPALTSIFSFRNMAPYRNVQPAPRPPWPC
jgi:hypothetical protein